MSIRLRPHQILCCIGFEGQGYGPQHVANMAHIVRGALRGVDGPATQVRIGADAGTLCAPCSLRRGPGCAEQALVDGLDARHGAALGLTPGDTLTRADCLYRVRVAVAPDDLDALCVGCRWLPSGLCKLGVAALRPPDLRGGTPVGAAP